MTAQLITSLEQAGEGSRESDIDELLRRSVEAFKAMTPEARAAMIAAQRASYIRGMTTPCEHGVLDFEQCGDCRATQETT